MKNNLTALRQEQSLSQEELASILGVSRQTINSIETGKFDPSLKLVIKITRFFKAELESIFIFEENA
ncbi:MAG: helix-turn-helix transcriptional regulator [Proteobacteria bacterium]|uniref:XRE family transcriptional regulator n=1 Tax=SAR86 cluster bacterium BACL1 MAG-120820-bin45 TaxID=1655612 RepID=A0A0R2U7M2_9GAMM|nr:MAG: XRE family transcriptional regulator [SAR86 cluster bacterium BACL1 MAG-120820-bin45]MDA0759299.1 helix-turn-helix transcriptional regulator [Pseudomonadota bacterium]MDA0881356.1 helix-turn-helix transcriptional regulator [Pseudomonadota bacterium]MDA1341872.1 helix-turn-helix transcriptional regulator [Pseudomonadota bacterium]